MVVVVVVVVAIFGTRPHTTVRNEFQNRRCGRDPAYAFSKGRDFYAVLTHRPRVVGAEVAAHTIHSFEDQVLQLGLLRVQRSASASALRASRSVAKSKVR